MLYGLLNLPWWGYVIVTLLLTHITIASVTIFLHRSQAHRGLDLHPISSHFFRFWLWLTTGTVTKEWVAVHRKHHAKVETADDPHSPQIYGLNRVLFFGLGLYQRACKNKEDLEHFGIGTPNDWLEKNVYSAHSNLGILAMLIMDLLLFGACGFIVWGAQMLWIPFFAGGVINGIGHFWGYRNFETPDSSRNIMPWGILIGGEELHNNHHAFGTSAKMAVRKWEFDLGWFYIKCLSRLGLAKIKRVVPKLEFDNTRFQIDMDSVKALIRHRVQIMDRYWRDVILPVLRTQRSNADIAEAKLFRRSRKLLIRDDSLINIKAQKRLKNLLAQYHDLRIVYQFRLGLQTLWQRHSGNSKELLENLQEWCKQAEATGIQALQEFAMNLKYLSCKPMV